MNRRTSSADARLIEGLLRTVLRAKGRQRWLWLAVIAVGILAWRFGGPSWEQSLGRSSSDVVDASPTEGEQEILDAFAGRRSDVMIRATATVQKVLPDDDVGDRHQKLILRLSSGHTLLLAHNIDLAERVPAREGDKLEVCGEYEYSESGGVVHWTHHDPAGRRLGGWIRLRGRRYE